ncbi:MAG TPA: GGDEF domain-containing protein [Thermoanaerobaculia bacterium]
MTWLTAAFACALLLITFGLSWRARQSQERWSRLISVETEAIGRLDELIRAQNAFRGKLQGTDASAVDRYDAVEQLLDSRAVQSIDTSALRVRVRAYRMLLLTRAPQGELNAESVRIVVEAQRLIEAHKSVIARQLPTLEHDANGMMLTGIGVAWIIVILSFALATLTHHRVVRPIEKLAEAADRIAAGDVTARAPVGGDLDVAKLGVAFNHMADELNARARTDDLTGLPNFRAFRERSDVEIARAMRYAERFGVLILDLDRFKMYNDRFGHLAGNAALQRVAQVIRETVRAVDFPARYGGEEFAVIVPLADAEALARVAERIRANVAGLPAAADGTQVTISIGAAIFPDDGELADVLFHTADERLYEAKRLGRNRVVVGPIVPRAAQSGG